MADLDLIIAPNLPPDSLLGLQLHLLDLVAARNTPPLLLLHTSPGRYLSLGRYHLYAGPSERAGINAYRRLTGGRIYGAGQGWLSLALILPTRTSLLKEDATRLKPDQVMNRYARGLLAGMRTLGVNSFYPGRDAITFNQREIAMCTFECNPSGAMLFEAAVALNRGMEEVVHDLERFDADSALACAMYGPESATKMVRELDRDVTFDELAGAIADGYAGLLGGINRRELTSVESAQAEHRGRELIASGWLNRSVGPASVTLKNRMASQLGASEAAVGLNDTGTVETLTLSGDFIANSPAVAELETELRGKPLELATVSRAVTKIFSGGENFILGAGELSNLVRLIAGVN